MFHVTSLETGNELAREIGGYEHVTVLRHIRVVDEAVAEHVKQLPRGTVAGDCILLSILLLNLLFCNYLSFIFLGSLTGFSS